jgi:serine/threonine protein kinase
MHCATKISGSTQNTDATAATLVSQTAPHRDPVRDRVRDDPDLVPGSPIIEPATMIGEVYRVIGTLGAGAMGTVFLAQDESLDRRVAIKLIRADLLDWSFRVRFTEEARAMARVNHPNVLQIYSFGQHEGVPYFVMEFVNGETLEEWLTRAGAPPDIELALRILDETCHGLSAIHAAKTLHRDLKPSNILLDARLRPHIADMGLAMFRRDERSAARAKPEVVGTPAYMAPEVAFCRDVDPAHRSRADVYSLGCIAYELLTGRPPFPADNQVGQMFQHATVAAAPPSSLNPLLPPEIDEAILRAMAKDPAERTPTPEAFRRDLTRNRQISPEPERILVAEDDDDSRDALRVFLQWKFPDAEVECVGDGFSVVAAFERKVPSVVVLDICMPGLDGFKVTEQLRAREDSQKVPIIIVTASGGPVQWERLSALGADGFLVKPASLEDVVALVRRSMSDRISSVARPQVPATAP